MGSSQGWTGFEQLLKRSEILRDAVKAGELTMLRGIYDVETGRVRFID